MEDFVSFEIAKKLKEKGFPQHITEDAYIIDNYSEEKYNIGDRLPIQYVPDYMADVAAPTISQVLKWLRNTHKLFISPCVITDYQDDFHRDTTYWSFIVVNIESGDAIYREYERVTEKRYESYEQAAIAGVNYCLENMI